jgi:hypothetical protein
MFPVPWFVTGVQTLSGTCRHVVWGISTQISFSAKKDNITSFLPLFVRVGLFYLLDGRPRKESVHIPL